MNYLFSSESVSEGHPDKVADQISDALVDQFLAYDDRAHCAIESFVTTGQVVIMGEVRSNVYIDLQTIARKTINQIGYNKSDYQFDGNSCGVLTAIHEQSDDINRGVSRADEEEQGAGDQGMMFGFACDETPEFMPMPIALAHRLTRRLAQVRKNGSLPYLRPDGKSQVTVVYEDGRPVAVDTVVISTQHDPDVAQEQLAQDVMAQVIREVIPAQLLTAETKYFINPTGRFVLGGPAGDSGLTGRKIIVDTYGGYAPHGGGAFSGKDPTKVDRSAAYAARHAAKNIVAAGLARQCEIQLAYAIGVAQPVSLLVDTKGTGVVPDDKLAAMVARLFDLRPDGIIKRFDLRRPIYRQTAAYGHFGRTDVELPWERLDYVDALKAEA